MRVPRRQIRPLAASGVPVPVGSSWSSGERLFFSLALGLITVWGLGGYWKLPGTPQVRSTTTVESDQRGVRQAGSGPNADSALADRGGAVFKDNACDTCHSIDGEEKSGPGLSGTYGERRRMSGGGTVIVDDAYIRQSILEPQAKIVEGYDDSMPSYEGLITDEDLKALTAYIRSLER